jgi:lipopolysaccharide/colanic/teichoic acid biosynthesis glycosyltransferase
VIRAFDVMIAGAGLIALSPLLVVFSVAIRLTSGSPVLYRGLRVGRSGRVFVMFKLRTLAADAETRLGPFQEAELSRRTQNEVTRVGRVLRRTHIDEVPQLFNVLLGDMSMVGPRPIRPAFYASLTDEIPQYWQRLVVRPGVTGFAQTRVIRDESWANKLAHDMEFIADRSIGLYLHVLAATLARAIRGDSAPAGGSWS